MNVNQIFKDLGSMVEEQGAMIGNIFLLHISDRFFIC